MSRYKRNCEKQHETKILQKRGYTVLAGDVDLGLARSCGDHRHYCHSEKETLWVFGLAGIMMMNTRVNKKGVTGPMLIGIIAAVVLVVAASFSILPPLKKLGVDWAEENLNFDFAITEKTTPIIDEERIDAETLIEIEAVAFDSQSGNMVIVKQAYGKGWSLINNREICRIEEAHKEKIPPEYNDFSIEKKKVLLAILVLNGDLSEEEYLRIILICDGSIASAPVENEKLSVILANDNDLLRGSITVHGKTYVHVPTQNNFCWFVSHNEENTYGGEQYNDNDKNCQWDEEEPYTDTNNNGTYDAEEPVYNADIDKIAQLLIADLFNKAGGET